MDAFKRIVNIPASQLIGLAIAIATIGGFLIGAYTWLQTPDYRVLFAGVSDRDGGAIVTSLTAMNVPYKFGDGGSAIMIPSDRIAEIRMKLAAQDLPKGGVAGFELLDQQKFGTTQLQEQVNFQRGLEGELTRSIQSISAVQSARVHLAIPKPTIFLREHQKPTASVVLALFPGKTLEASQVQGIAHLVSSALPELTDQNVSIVDGKGNLLSRAPEAGGLDPGKLAYQHDLEQNDAHRITAMIETIVGPGNVRAEVAADVDFSQTEQTAETFKPNGPNGGALRSQQSTESSNSSGSGAAGGGVPGAQSNTPANAGAPASAANAPGSSPSSSSTKKDNVTNYEVDRVVETKKLPVGTIKRLSVAIVVNNRAIAPAAPGDAKDAKKDAPKDAKGDASKAAAPVATSRPLTKEEIDQITALARESIGFDEKRGDTISVANASFPQPEVLVATDVPMWKDPDTVSTAKEVGKNVAFALLAFYLLFGVLRPAIRRVTTSSIATTALPAPDATPTESRIEVVPQPALAYQEHLQRARQLSRDDPKAIAGLVRNWVAANE